MGDIQYKVINSAADVQEFQQVSNGLHDGYLTCVAYVNSGIASGKNGHTFDYAGKSLVIHVLVTSLPGEPTFEMVFHKVLEWQVNEYQLSDMNGFSIMFLDHGLLLWADDICSAIARLNEAAM